jgi:hypothetical protein
MTRSQSSWEPMLPWCTVEPGWSALNFSAASLLPE